MFEIDKAKFGAFIAELRKEKGITQKELAKQLAISDKAISKWETGNSIPDVTLLVPLAEILGVSVTELLECRRIETPESMDTAQTDVLVKKVIELSEEERSQKKKKNLVIYIVCVFISIVGLVCLYKLHEIGVIPGTAYMVPILITTLLSIIFGAYFWIFIKEKLPSYYDENQINVYVDGIFHMNLPGVYYNNNNWPYILKALRGWSIAGMVFFPMIYLPLSMSLMSFEPYSTLIISLGFLLGGLFVPIFVLARKHQYGDNPPARKTKRVSMRNIGVIVILFLLLFVTLAGGFGGLGTIRSGTSVMFFSNEGRSYWHANYQYFDGYMQRNLWVDEDGVLEIDIETDEGILDLEIKDEDGNIIYTEENVGTKEFELEASGRVTIRVQADGHEGSFDFD